MARVLALRGIQSPIKKMEAVLSKREKIERIRVHFKAILETLDLDVNDPNIEETPLRVAKLYVDELCAGLNSS